jgi:predicted MPP superfamily phosphohydrolase
MVMDFRRFRKKHTPEHQYPKKKRHVDGLVLHPSVRWLRTFEEQDGYKILLCHHPEYYEPHLKAKHIDLVVSGHAHGGQIRIPLVGGVIAPNQGYFPKLDKGLYIRGNTRLIVSRGLGNSLFPFRVNNRPEIVLVTLKHC